MEPATEGHNRISQKCDQTQFKSWTPELTNFEIQLSLMKFLGRFETWILTHLQTAWKYVPVVTVLQCAPVIVCTVKAGCHCDHFMVCCRGSSEKAVRGRKWECWATTEENQCDIQSVAWPCTGELLNCIVWLGVGLYVYSMLFVTCNVMLQQRHALLEDSIRLFGFYRECDDFEKWIKDKERMLRADDSTENVEAAKCKFEVRDLGHL